MAFEVFSITYTQSTNGIELLSKAYKNYTMSKYLHCTAKVLCGTTKPNQEIQTISLTVLISLCIIFKNVVDRNLFQYTQPLILVGNPLFNPSQHIQNSSSIFIACSLKYMSLFSFIQTNIYIVPL